MKPVWIVDDDPSIRFVLERALARAPERARPLAGLVLAARESGDTVAADRAMAQLRTKFERGDELAAERLLTTFRVK